MVGGAESKYTLGSLCLYLCYFQKNCFVFTCWVSCQNDGKLVASEACSRADRAMDTASLSTHNPYHPWIYLSHIHKVCRAADRVGTT